MIILLIILYSVAFVILFNRSTKNSEIRLTRNEIALAFGFKVAMGCLYGYVFQKYYGGDDTWKYFNDSLLEYNKFLFQSGQFFKEIIPVDSFHKYPAFADNFRDFMEYLEYNVVVKYLAVVNIFSFQNYYTDVVFFNVFSFFGSYLLFKVFTASGARNRLLVYLASFFIPSITFWLSGIRSDGLLFLSIAMTLYYFNAWLDSKKGLHLFYFLIGLLGTFIFRLQFMMILIPFLVAWYLSVRFSIKPWKSFTGVFVVSLIIFFGSIYLSDRFNFPSLIVKKQQEFLALKGNTVFALNTLEPTFSSFITTLPQAFENTFLRPYPWEARGFLQIAASAEIIFFWIIFFITVKNILSTRHSPLVWFVLFFSVCTYLLIGFTVPFPGAIVRYKVIPELLMLLILLPAFPVRLKKIYI